MASQSSNTPGLHEVQPTTQSDDYISRMGSLTLLDTEPTSRPNPHYYTMVTVPNRPHCACIQCECPDLARIPTVYVSNSGHTSAEPQPTFCLRCERVELWGKNEPSYKGCKCECRCRLQRVDGELQCGDCLVANQENPHRHRPHGKA
ncbi:hypothetical protein F4813DRAFT_373452 [Daldinia decipiens]|uniref:uncharacterized protein n=1 Tax=Daldinia decipiens TaxID=326647 RepID=UPI0020C3691A|nr:uncharacterized protein F4813DRAFT_373452 [Daldinia decipiens]KAI1653781.1 hypothetical protein F4813DRAFT_373452 [Daldinia decipiens]